MRHGAFANAAELLDHLDTAGEDVGCVILDVHMPGMGGPNLQEVMNRRTPPVPVIVLTGTNDAGLLAMAAAAGVANVLRKPCESERLLRAVAAAIGESPRAAPTRADLPTHTTTASGRFGSTRASLGDPDKLVLEEGRGIYRPVGSVSFDETVALVRAAIAAARSNQVRSLLVNTTALTGFTSPDQFERFLAAVAWAEESRAGLHLALVARAEMIHPQKFGVLVAANRGLVSNIFTTEAEAHAWLDAWDGQ